MDRFEGYFERFDTLMESAKRCVELYPGSDDEERDEYADLFRWMWVAGVSALDKLVHDLVREGMMIIFERNFSHAHKKFVAFYLEVCKKKMQLPSRTGMFRQWIVEQHRAKTFQTMRNIADALALALPELAQIPEEKNNRSANAKTSRSLKLAERILELAPEEFGRHVTPEEFHDEFNSMIERRNQIVHQGDYPNNRSDDRLTATKADAERTWKYMKCVGEAVYTLVSQAYNSGD